jgi:hypothetical protein
MFHRVRASKRVLIAVVLGGLTAAALGGYAASSALRTSGQDPAAPAGGAIPEPAPGGPGAPCVTSAQNGGCGPYHYAGISGSDGYNTQIDQDMWNAIAGASQRLAAYNPGRWSVMADMPAGNTAVVSYPDVQEIYTTASNRPDPLSSFRSITSSFTAKGPGSGGGDDYEAAYDIWAGTGTNNGAQEIMIWVDNHGQTPAGSKVATADIQGASYSVWSAGRNPVSLVLNSNKTSGTIDILAALDWLESHGYMPQGSGVNQINFGWEICSTGGSAKTFSVTRYKIKSSCASGASCLCRDPIRGAVPRLRIVEPWTYDRTRSSTTGRCGCAATARMTSTPCSRR